MTDPAKTHRRVVFLMAAYGPFLFLVAALTGFVAYLFGRWAWNVAEDFNFVIGALVAIPAVILAGFVVSLLSACRAFFGSMVLGDPMELRLTPKAMKGLSQLVREVAEEQSLPLPDEIRLHAESLAHVYEEGTKPPTSKILVIGGAALASLDRTALSGVIAHELGHFAGGDTSFSRRALRWQRMMLYVDFALRRKPWNPLGWMLRGYHLLFQLAWAANQRAQEYKADRYQVQRIGEKQTARTLIALDSIDEMPWSRLSSVAEWFALMRTKDGSVFSEQVRRARQATPAQWEEACRRALQRNTGRFDSHPCLRDRLKAIGVSPKNAVRLAAKLQPGETEPSEFIKGWDALDSAMSTFLVALVQRVQENKRDMASIILGRSMG